MKIKWKMPVLLLIAIIVACSGANDSEINMDQKVQARRYIDSLLRPNIRPEYYIRNVSIIDTRQGMVTSGQNVLVRNGIVERLGSEDFDSEGAIEIDGASKFLMPGMADMHVHIISDTELIDNLFLFLAKGVTAIRVMWGTRSMVELRDEINREEIIGPRMFVASAGFNGRSDAWGSAVITPTDADIIENVQEYAELGFDYIKVYSGLDLEQYNVLMNEASRLGITAIGHLPNRVSLKHMAAMGQYSVEHLSGFNSNPESTSFKVAANDLKVNNTWVCPTLTVFSRSTANIDFYLENPILNQMSSVYRDWYRNPLSQPVLSSSAVLLQDRITAFNGVHEAQVNIIAGTDTGIRYIYPGEALHEELRLYVRAGLSNLESLKTATINVGEYLSDESGEVKTGGRADLVLLDENPLGNLDYLSGISGVMVSGNWFSRSTIDSVLKKMEVVHK